MNICFEERFIFILSLTVYAMTCSNSVGTTDSPELITAAYEGGVPHPPGYPLLTIVLKLWLALSRMVPYGSFNASYSAAILNSIFAAIRIVDFKTIFRSLCSKKMEMDNLGENPRFSNVLMYKIFREVTMCSISALVSTSLLSFSNMFWHRATMLEVFTLNNCFTTRGYKNGINNLFRWCM